MNVENRTIYAYDCLEILSDEDALPSNSVDLIYLDPPFNSKSTYNLPFKGKYKKDAKQVAAFTDTWTWGDKQEKYFEDLHKGVTVRKKCLVKTIELVKTLELNQTGSSRKSRGGGAVYPLI